MTQRSLNPPRIAAILGPTNTGKTHYAVERMLARSSGAIGLPLRLLAREVYDKICAIKGPSQCALVTGEEKIQPVTARYFVCTVEAMPMERRFAFLAVDEIQLMSNFERGHIFTDRLLHARGTEETLFLGAETVRPVIQDLVRGVEFDYRERFSELSYGGPVKLTRMPKRSVIVAFSAAEVYALAEIIRRQRGGAAVVMGGLSPRTRNAQAELYQSGDVDFLIATDAVGMGLNLDTDHVAFASTRKYDGRNRRMLTPMELGQIAGRAGRFRNNGTFGTTGDCPPIDDETVARIEGHKFDPLTHVQWRNAALNFSSVEALDSSLHVRADSRRLRRSRGITDELSLERLSAIDEVNTGIRTPHDVKRLWDICQVPDFRNATIDAHVRLLQDLYRLIVANNGKLPNDFLHKRISRLDETTGGVDILSTRLAQIRTWTYCANKVSWTEDSDHWIGETRAVEDRLSDALHESLIARFVDKRTSALLKGIGLGAPMETTVKDTGEVWVDGHLIGTLNGLTFKPDTSSSDLEAKALQAAAAQAIGPEIDRRLTSLCGGTHAIFTLDNNGHILWGGKAVGKIAPSGSVFNPDADLIGAEFGNANLRDLAVNRMRDFLRAEMTTKLEPLHKLKALSESAETLPSTRGFAYTLLENFGTIDRAANGKLVKDLEQDARKQLREIGVIFGQYTVYMRELLKPKPATLLSLLLAYGAGGDKKPFIPFAGVTSIPNEGELASTNFTDSALALSGFKASGPRIIRFDILNRLSNLIRQAQNEAKGRRFQIMQEMLALLGSSHEDVRGVLHSLGYKHETIEPKPEADVKTPLVEAQAEAPTPAPETETVSPPDSTTEAKASEEAATEAPSDAADATPAATETATVETTTAETAAAAPVPAPRKRTVKPLNLYIPRKENEDGSTTEVPNTEFWFMPFKRTGGKPRGAHQNRNDRQNNASRGKSARYSKGGKKPNSRDTFSPAKSSPPRRSADSPFAALAALKTPKKDG
ncbi:MAG: helicase-related protein [Maricaulaceae bacterium]